jgi:autotransporter-associated beta strand protein
MKTKLTVFKLLILLCGTFLTTAVFGQTTLVWTNQLGGQIGVTANWNPNGVPNPNSGAPGDTMQFDGQTVGPLYLKADGGLNAGVSGSAVGLVIYMDSNQVSSVNIAYDVPGGFNSTGVRTANITVDPGAGTLSLGNTNQNVALYMVLGGVNGQIHEFLNNSANPAIIYPGWRLAYGGGGSHTISFDGPGNWYVTNSLVAVNGSQTIISKSGTGTMIWQYAVVPVVVPNSQIQGPVTINAGTLIVDSGNLLNNLTGSQTMVNNGTLFEYDGQANALGSVANGTISLSISGTGPIQVNNGTLTLSGANTYAGGTTISAGTLQVGAGGTSGSIGTGNVTDHGVFVFNRSDGVTFTNVISGSGSLVQNGTGMLTLSGANTYTGPTTVSNGTLVITGSSVGGDMDVSGGILVPVGVGTVSNFNVGGSMNINSGTIVASLNKSLSPSNTTFTVTGTINSTGGTLKLLNFGPDLVVGDTFAIFSQPVGGNAMTIVSPGFTVNNNLAVDGSVAVNSIAPAGSGQITAAVSAGQLNLSWPATWTGLHLQVQTNSLTVGLSNNWVTIPGTDAGNSYSATLNSSNGSVFFRLAP